MKRLLVLALLGLFTLPLYGQQDFLLLMSKKKAVDSLTVDSTGMSALELATISPALPLKVHRGSSETVTFTAPEGYTLDSLFVDGVLIRKVNQEGFDVIPNFFFTGQPAATYFDSLGFRDIFGVWQSDTLIMNGDPPVPPVIESKIRARADTALAHNPYKGRVWFDFEYANLDSNYVGKDSAQAAAHIYATNIGWAKNQQPTLKYGVYGQVPNFDYYMNLDMAWRPNSNDLLQELTDTVDFIMPSLYLFDSEANLPFKGYAGPLITESHRIAPGKDVLPIIAPAYHPVSGAPYANTYTSGTNFAAMLNTIHDSLANGVIIWAGYQAMGSAYGDWATADTSAWWTALKRFVTVPPDSFAFSSVAANHTVRVKLKINTYTITASSDTNGSISPSGIQTVNWGTNNRFTFTPDTLQEVSYCVIDGVQNNDSTAGYTFLNVSANHTISVVYKSSVVPLLPYSDAFTGASLGARWTAPASWVVASGTVSNTPWVYGNDIMVDGGLEGTYTGGKNVNAYWESTANAVQCTDVHGGSKAQALSFTNTGGLLEPSGNDPGVGKWCRMSVWGKRISGTGNNVYFRALNAATFKDTINQATYTNYVVTLHNTNSYVLAEVGSIGSAHTDSVVIDDFSGRTMSVPTLFATVDAGDTVVNVGVKVTLKKGTQAGVVVAYVDSANYVIAYHDGVNCKLEKVVAGTWTTVKTGTPACVAGAVVQIQRNATTWKLYYNGSQVSTDATISDTALRSNTKVGIFSTYEGNILDDFSAAKP